MQKYINKDRTVGVDSLELWLSNLNSVRFLSATSSASMLDKLLTLNKNLYEGQNPISIAYSFCFRAYLMHLLFWFFLTRSHWQDPPGSLQSFKILLIEALNRYNRTTVKNNQICDRQRWYLTGGLCKE